MSGFAGVRHLPNDPLRFRPKPSGNSHKVPPDPPPEMPDPPPWTEKAIKVWGKMTIPQQVLFHNTLWKSRTQSENVLELVKLMHPTRNAWGLKIEDLLSMATWVDGFGMADYRAFHLSCAREQWEEFDKDDKRGTLHGRLLVLSVKDIDTAKPRDYLLKGLLSPGEVSLWVGPPKCGKSFLLLFLAYMLSLARSVFGCRVKPTKVLYVAAEGEAGIANRIRALRNKYGPSRNFHFIAQPADLLHTTGDKADLIAAAKECGAQLIVLDTLSRLMAGGDENSPQDMGTFVLNVAELRQETGAHVAIVHHGTKASNGSKSRGHGSLEGADDALIEVLKLDDGSRQATVVHAKDDPDGMRWGFKLEPVELGIDGDGDPITTLITIETDNKPPPPKAKDDLSANQQIAMTALFAALAESAFEMPLGDGIRIKVVAVDTWRQWFFQQKPGDNKDTKERTFRRVADELKAKAKIGCLDTVVWPNP